MGMRLMAEAGMKDSLAHRTRNDRNLAYEKAKPPWEICSNRTAGMPSSKTRRHLPTHPSALFAGDPLRLIPPAKRFADSISHPQFLSFSGQLVQNASSGVVVLPLERHQVIKSHTPILADCSALVGIRVTALPCDISVNRWMNIRSAEAGIAIVYALSPLSIT